MMAGRTGSWLLIAATGAVLVVLVPMRTPRSPQGAGSVAGVLDPVTIVVQAKIGGTVRAVRTQPGERVAKGQLLFEMEPPEGEGALLELSRVADGIPRGASGQQTEGHGEVMRAEADYVAALTKLENGTGSRAGLQRAARNRQAVRQRIARVLGDASQTLGGLAARVNRLRAEAEVRAPVDGVVDLIGPRPGDRVQPGQAVAILTVPNLYEAEVVPPPGYPVERVRAGMKISGVVVSTAKPFQAAVQSIGTRRVPVALRGERQAAVEPVVRVRLEPAEPLAAGTKATFLLP